MKNKKDMSSKEISNTFFELFVDEDIEERELDEKEKNYLDEAFNLLNNWKREQMFLKGETFNKEFSEFLSTLKERWGNFSSIDEIKKIIDKIYGDDYEIKMALYRKLFEKSKEDLDEAKLDLYIYTEWKKHIKQKK